MVVGNFGQGGQVGDDVFGVTDTLDVNGFRVLIDSVRKVLWISGLDKLRPYPKLLQEDYEPM